MILHYTNKPSTFGNPPFIIIYGNPQKGRSAKEYEEMAKAKLRQQPPDAWSRRANERREPLAESTSSHSHYQHQL